MNPITSPTILVVDPCGLDLTATSALLHDNGYDVHCAQDVDAALKAAQSLPIDLVIYDVSIDHETTESLLDKIRALPERNDVPAMFISSTQTPDVVRRTDQYGSSYYLRKPFESEVMLELVDKALWMPHLVNNHILQPHFNVKTGTSVTESLS